MKSKKFLASLLTLTMVASVALVGCGSDKNTSGSGSSDGSPDSEQYLNILLEQEPKTIDPSKSTDLYSSQILSNTQEALTRITQDEEGKDKIEPGMAESWEQSEDGLTWTFKLRDAKWNDGVEVTAEQFVYGITRTLDAKTASNYSFLLFPIKNAAKFNAGEVSAEEVGVKAVDDKTIEFTLESPCAYFLDLTYFKVMQPQREDIIAQHGDTYGSEANTMAYCGPFTMTEWQHNSQVVLAKNENYWDAENVKLDTVTMKIIKENSAAMNELYSGALDVAPVKDPEWIQKLDNMGEFESRKGYDASVSYTFFNQEDELFSNDKIRKAFIIAEDRAGKIETLRKGLGDVALGFVPPSVQIGGEDFRTTVNSSPVQDLIDENKDPKALLIEGMKELGLGEDPSTITINYLQSGTDAIAREFAEFQQQVYKETLGINVEVDYVEWPIFTTMTNEMDYQVASMGWSGDYNDPNTYLDMWESGAGIVPTGWSSEEYDSLMQQARETTDQKERAELFAKAERILIYEDGVISPEAWRMKNTYVRNYVKNYSAPLFGTVDFKYTYTSGR